MLRFAELTVQARNALSRRDHAALARLMNENFDLRRSIMDLAPAHIRMVETARRSGASAKFAGSGGAIIGAYTDDAMFTVLQHDLTQIGCQIFRLNVPPSAP
jgi:glucuronokinase